MAAWIVPTIFCTVIFLKVTAAQDPCSPNVHEDLPFRTGRATNCQASIKSFCDDNLSPGWYKVNISTPMPTSCVSMSSCGVSIPIWMNGSIPLAEDGVVDRTACLHFMDCCYETIPIKMKNCSTFLTYYLETAPYCPTKYCFGSGEKCEDEIPATEKTTPARPVCGDGTFGEECTPCTCVADNTLYCSVSDGSCTCKEGWEGMTCANDIDECTVEVPCGEHSYCLNEPGFFTCQCLDGYTNYNDACLECEEGTYGTDCGGICTCRNDHTEYCDRVTGECVCKPGWIGADCSTALDLCSSVQCGEFEECVQEHGTYSCQCRRRYQHVDGICECEEWTHGTDCMNDCKCEVYNTEHCESATGACVCKPGWTGEFCRFPLALDLCSSVQCGEFEECVQEHGTYSCQCRRRYQHVGGICECEEWTHGRDCINDCNCEVDKTAYCESATGACVCKPGWTGGDCGTVMDAVHEYEDDALHASSCGYSTSLIAGVVISLLMVNVLTVVLTYILTRRRYTENDEGVYDSLQKGFMTPDPVYSKPYSLPVTKEGGPPSYNISQSTRSGTYLSNEPPSYETCKDVTNVPQEEGNRKSDYQYANI